MRGLGWACVLVLVGCGSSTGGGGGTGGAAGSAGATAGSGGSAGNSGSAGNGGSAGTGGASGGAGGGGAALNLGPDDIACEAVGGAGNCVACCSEAHAAWEAVAPVTRQCACTPQLCSDACPSYCSGDAGNIDCYSCIFPELVPSGACYSGAHASCNGELDCVQYVDCRANCVQLFGNTP
ncbi:MAG: hypothetical protein R3B07_05875 [Polyangiaceae bacterium]